MLSQTCIGEMDASTTNLKSLDFAAETYSPQIRHSFRVKLEKGEDGWIVASCPELKGAVTQGRTKEEALENITEVIFLLLEDENEEEPEFTVLWEEV